MEIRELHEIDADLTAIIPRLGRLCCTPRVAEETGMNRLLDERNERVQIIEDYERVFCDEF